MGLAMTVPEIIERCKELPVFEMRGVSDTYGELVFYSKNSDEWVAALSALAGPPVKEAGVRPTKEDVRLTAPFGGIRGEQTLFRKECARGTLVIMFWPWQSGAEITAKIILVEK